MFRSRLTHSAALAPSRLGLVFVWAGLGIVIGSTASPSTAAAGPPQIGKSRSSWSDSLWSPFSSWKFPSFSSSKSAAPQTKAAEPSITTAARTSMSRTWKSVQRSTRSAWESTKYALRPYDPPAESRAGAGKRNAKREQAESGGFWSSLFGGSSPPPREATVNDFLRQPTPY
ncbi:hypothetical protein [Candidatus Laterigemmans baculatus]|uniref:hypothetical protein n=1 Tax=Candidatus Laterigemmans baculatus TaxID=2770505 RepID=UPI0013DD4236|nr:hypothetical protein [Candidatus Laterigemmans baculatus]